MTVEDLRNELRDRGGEASVWLVYLADTRSELEGGRSALVLQAAFFTRGEAYATGHRLHHERRWQHYYVFQLVADLAWCEGTAARAADYEFAFGRVRELPLVTVTPEQLTAVRGK